MERSRALAAWLTTRRVLELEDEDGRPVGEVGASWYGRIVTETAICPYPDARRGGVLNRSALRQMGGAWPALLATFRALAGPDPRLVDGFRAALVGITAPAVAHLAAPDRPISRTLAGQFKTSLGLSQVLAALLLAEEGVADAPMAELGDGEAFFAQLDRGRWLIGQEQVCAGTRGMIVEAWDALVGPGEGGLHPELAALEPRGWVDLAHALVGAVAAAGLAVGGRADGLEAWLGPSGPAWTRALFSSPGRGPDHVRRLFAAGAVPPPVEAMIAMSPAAGEVWADRIVEAVNASC